MAKSSLEVLGIIFSAGLLYYFGKKMCKVIYTYAIGPAVNKVDFKSMGQWALVTGCTDGIGKEYARELASRGCDIVLISRSLDKLKATAQELENDFKVSTKVIQVDFTDGKEIYEKIEKEIAGLEIGTLVNNVGMSYTYPEYYLDIPDWDKTITVLIRANIVALTRMTKLVLPEMVKREKGVIINISSGTALIPSPLLTVYAAAKAYVDKFSEGLEIEYAKKGITVQSVLPGFVCSKMSGLRRKSFIAPTAPEFVKSAIGLVGTTSKTTGYLPHSMFIGVITSIEGVSKTFAHWMITRSLENNRRKYLQKYKSQ